MNGRPILRPAELKRLTRDTKAGAAEPWTMPPAYAPTRRHSSSLGAIAVAAVVSWAILLLVADVVLHAIRTAL